MTAAVEDPDWDQAVLDMLELELVGLEQDAYTLEPQQASVYGRPLTIADLDAEIDRVRRELGDTP